MQLLVSPYSRLGLLLVISIWFGVNIGRLIYEPEPARVIYGLIGSGLLTVGLFIACIGDFRTRRAE